MNYKVYIHKNKKTVGINHFVNLADGEVIEPSLCMTFLNHKLVNNAFGLDNWTQEISNLRCKEVLPKIKKALLNLVYTRQSYNCTRELKLLGKLELVCMQYEDFIIEII